MIPIEPQPAAPKPKLRWYQFSLRSLLVLTLLVSIGMSWIAVELRKAKQRRELPQTMGGGQSSVADREYRNIDCQIWTDGDQRFYYAICMGYVDFDPNLPAPPIRYEFTYHDERGELLIDGKKIEPSHRGQLLALNPFGRMVEISLSPDEEGIVASGVVEQVWEDVVLKRLYQRAGQLQNGRPVGHWTYCDSNGRKGYEGTYLQGKRDSKWTYYHENGKLRAEIMYKQGKLHGQCKYYDAEGKRTDSVSWEDDYPIDRSVRQVGIGHSEARNPNRTSTGGNAE